MKYKGGIFMKRTKDEINNKIKELEEIISSQEVSWDIEYLEGLSDGIKWSSHKLPNLDLDRFK